MILSRKPLITDKSVSLNDTTVKSATGLSVTAYPLFFIVVPCILVGWLADIARHRRMPRGLPSHDTRVFWFPV